MSYQQLLLKVGPYLALQHADLDIVGKFVIKWSVSQSLIWNMPSYSSPTSHDRRHSISNFNIGP